MEEPYNASITGESKREEFILSTIIWYLPEATFFCPSLRITRSRAFVPRPSLINLS